MKRPHRQSEGRPLSWAAAALICVGSANSEARGQPEPPPDSNEEPAPSDLDDTEEPPKEPGVTEEAPNEPGATEEEPAAPDAGEAPTDPDEAEEEPTAPQDAEEGPTAPDEAEEVPAAPVDDSKEAPEVSADAAPDDGEEAPEAAEAAAPDGEEAPEAAEAAAPDDEEASTALESPSTADEAEMPESSSAAEGGEPPETSSATEGGEPPETSSAGTTLPVEQPDPPLPPRPSAGPFAQHSIRVSATLGWATAANRNWFILGIGGGYFVLDGLAVDAGATFWLGADPFMASVSPGLRYVFHMVPTVKPYVGAFYRHYFVADNALGWSDSDSLGGRLGINFMTGASSYFGGGVIYERILDTNLFAEQDQVYPEITFAIAF